MTVAGAPPSTAAAPAAPRGRRFATNLAIGCGGLLLVLILLALVAVWWLWSTGEQFDTQRIVGPRAAGWVHVGDLSADAGVLPLVAELARRLQEAEDSRRSEHLPEPLHWLRDLRQAVDPTTGLRWLLPREMTFAAHASAPRGDLGYTFAVNPRGLTRLATRFLRRAADTPPVAYHEGELFDLGGGATAALIGGTFLMSTERAAAETAIDRLRPGADATPPPAPGDGPWDAMARLESALAAVALEALGIPPEIAAGVRGVDAGLDVATADEIRVRATFTAADPASLAALQAAVAERLERLSARLGPAAPDLSVQHQAAGDTLTTHVTATRLGPTLDAITANPRLHPGSEPDASNER